MIIYLITNLCNGKKYVGQTSLTAEARWQCHIYNARGNPSRSKYPLYQAIRKYGPKSFTVEVLDTAKTQEDLNALEIKYIAYYGTTFKDFGYNRHTGGNKPPLSTPESRRKAGLKMRGRKVSDETKEKMSLAAKGHRHFLGKTHSKETKEKISIAHKIIIASKGHGHRTGQKSSPEHRAKISAALIGKTLSKETRLKISLAKTNPSDEARKRLSDSHKGKPWSEKRLAAYLAKKAIVHSYL